LLKPGYAEVPDFQHKYGAVECWPGDHVPPAMSWCEFRDNVPLKFQYYPTLTPQTCSSQLHWESDRFGRVRMEQHFREYQWLVRRLQGCRNLLVIGSRHGGMEYHLTRDLPDLKVTGLDIDPLPGNNTPKVFEDGVPDDQTGKIGGRLGYYRGKPIGAMQTCLYHADSQDRIVQSLVEKERGPFDAVFIDGDHTAEGVRKDWLWAVRLLSGNAYSPTKFEDRPKRPVRKIFFHDFTPAIYHRLTGCTVHEVMPEVRQTAESNGWSVCEKVVGCGWGGILEVDLEGEK